MKLTTKQAAQRAGVSVSMVYQWCNERLLVHYRCGAKGRRGKILVEESDLEALLARCKVNASELPSPPPVSQPERKQTPLKLEHVRIKSG
jgi:excisionase family DNA binding protein